MRNYILSMECHHHHHHHHSQSVQMRRIYFHPPIEEGRNLMITDRCGKIEGSSMPGLRSTQLPRLLYENGNTQKLTWKFLLCFKPQKRLLECYNTAVELIRYMMYQYFEIWPVFKNCKGISELQKPIKILPTTSDGQITV